MKNNRSIFALLLAVLVLLPGCILHVPSYRRQPLRIMRDSFMYSGSNKDVVIRVKQLNKDDKYDQKKMLNLCRNILIRINRKDYS